MTGFTKQIVLALLLTFFTAVQAAPAPADKKGCGKPLVRREWRALSEGERKEWVDAVKVGSIHPKRVCFVDVDSLVVPPQDAPQVGVEAHWQRYPYPDSPRRHQKLVLRWYA